MGEYPVKIVNGLWERDLEIHQEVSPRNNVYKIATSSHSDTARLGVGGGILPITMCENGDGEALKSKFLSDQSVCMRRESSFVTK